MRKRIEWMDERLPFPLRTVQTEFGPVDVYDIPEDQKPVVIKKLYPFQPLPGLEDVMEDIHAEKTFKVKDFMVTREERMNVLASPYYLEHGGTVIDWIPVYEDEIDPTV
ncbi:MAG TPA: hypothetical protein VMW46_10905 [Candidatus Desulfaltia sp.]|nr:hypothetical protein [Candidatus Desulfaltia sp.]